MTELLAVYGTLMGGQSYAGRPDVERLMRQSPSSIGSPRGAPFHRYTHARGSRCAATAD